ncbi:MAG: SLC13 family permease [Desulfotignum sp.]
MTPDMILTMIVLVFVICLFVFEWVRVDVVGIMMMVLLPLMSLVTPKEAFSGLSSNAVVSIIAVIIIGAGLDKTGVMNNVAKPIMALAGKSENRIILFISGSVAVISSLLQNIGAAALFLPVTQRISKRLGIPTSRVLMPMAFCAIIGGTITLVGASPTILLNDLMVIGGEKLAPFGLFTQTPIGLALVASALLYFVVFGKFVLPAQTGQFSKGASEMLIREYQGVGSIVELHVPETGVTGTLEELTVRAKFLVTVIGISSPSVKAVNHVPRSNETISPHCDVAVAGKRENIEKLAKEYGWQMKETLETFADTLANTNAGVAEAVVSPRSDLIGKTLNEVSFKEHYQLNPLVLFKDNKKFYSGLTYIPLSKGDTLLLQGPWDKFHILNNKPKPRSLVFASPLEGEILRPQKAVFAVFWLAIALFQVIFFDTALAVALMSGALGMIITGVLTIDEAYGAVDWMTVFLLGGLIPLGIAFEKSGTAAFIAEGVLGFVGTPAPIVLLAVIGIMTTFFTLVISNVGATVLLVPLCMNMAMMAGADPRMAALVVGLSASNSFILPTHQVNALVMRPGGYRTVDYAKAGIVMTFIFLTVELLMIYLFYGI